MTYLSMADLTQENARLRARVSVLESERRLNAGRKFDETDMIMAVSFAKTLGMSYRERNDALVAARHERNAAFRTHYIRIARSANRWVVQSKRQLRRALEVSP